ncbi:ABC transporter ATP-binding protein [Shewanella salipaludis]|uniref:ABC transporter ATP-binding protein n=1 Tax=Shewanella salipaludis TaxID=2723052 RepID=A0A972JJW2_9GAMM|nr:ABC transporter ATP-binding protein [Shewanella salipaludis]NMH64494.1 ABC transporter ATP-binding protein [Shewanella salipaludis]
MEAGGQDSAIVKCDAVVKTYQQGAIQVPALRGISLSIARGEFVSLAGASGSGKTTLLNMIGGLDRFGSGEVWVEGAPLSRMNNSELADLRLSKIGFVFQAYNLIPVLSARENVEFIMQLQGVAQAERRDLSRQILARVGLAGMEQRLPAELSGGQQQRVAVARALVSHPAIILADEPTANLDSKNSLELLTMMAELNLESGTTLIVATHDPQVIDFTRRKLVIKDGTVAEDY